MAITLAFSVAQGGDNKTIIITDTTGTATNGWDGTPAVSGINGTTNTLDLDIIITTSDGTVTSYDTIDLFAEFGTFSTVADLVFDLDCSMLLDSGVPLGTADDVFPDGLYEITYTYQKGLGGDESHTDAIVLIDGVVKSSLYESLRTIPTLYECDYNHERTVLDIVFIKGYYDSMIATAIVGRESQVLNQLYVLERLVLNGSKYSW